MNLFGLIILFSLISGTLSLVGGIALLGRQEWVRKFSIHFVSFAVGTLLAVAFLDLLPEALELGENKIEGILSAALLGIILFFAIERLILRFHPHHHTDSGEEPHHHPVPLLLTIGDSIHNFVDGVLLASAFLVSIPLGIVTALAVAAHELPQEFSDFSIMLYHGWSRRKVLWTNIFSSLSNVLGAVLAFLARDLITPVLPELLAITAGIFIYIAASDLIPDISSKTPPDKTSHVISLVLLGVAAVWLLGRILGG